MKFLTPVVRITFSLACLTSTTLFLSMFMGVFPDQRADTLRARAHLTECIAVHFTSLSSNVNSHEMGQVLAEVISRNPELKSIGIRRADGKYLIEAGEHRQHWVSASPESMLDTQTQMPLYANSSLWGTLEIRFVPTVSEWFGGLVVSPRIRTVLFVGAVSLTLFYLFLRGALSQLNPTKAVPRRVHEALDALAEGLVILDEQGRIVMANAAFSRSLERTSEKLIGQMIGSFPWQHKAGEDLPWKTCLTTGETLTGILIRLSETSDRVFSVSSVPIHDEGQKIRGAMVSFEDVTELEKNKTELVQMLDELRVSREEIQEQNQELERLAMQDPLTGCLNRRAFFGRFELQWRLAEKHQQPLSMIIIDVDHFKSVNDTFGHAMGDEVLRGVGGLLSSCVENQESACRYGGEEFCILLPNTSVDRATTMAEQLRIALSELKFEKLSITASLGVSGRELGAAGPQLMLEEADKCLYSAKRNGRNRVVRFDEIPHSELAEPAPKKEGKSEVKTEEVSISFEAVSALLSALSFRDQPTADHSRRVADLCVQVADGLLSKSDSYLLEMAALLHDVGKIGIPDSILLKAGQLTPEEWAEMNKQELYGVEIVRKAFASPKLAAIIENYRAFYNGCSKNAALPAGNAIPLQARLLAIADAYDSMTMSRRYRAGKTHEEAIHELRHCAGTQFDPQLVERFITVLSQTVASASADSDSETRSIFDDLGTIASCLQEKDMDRVATVTEHLKSVACRIGADNVQLKAEKLQLAILSDSDLLEILYTARELTMECAQLQKPQSVH